MPRLLGVDLGGTNLRAAVFDESGRRLSVAVADTQVIVDVPPMGRHYDPEALWRTACGAIREAVGGAGGSVDAVAATGQRLACAFLDGEGKTLYVGPNTDARGVMNGWQVEAASAGALYDRTGRGMPLLFAPARLLWFRDNQPELYGRVRRVLGLGDWLAHQLCGEAAVDVSGAVELLAVDVYTGRYWPELWSTLELDPAWLPPMLAGGAVAGWVTPAAAATTGVGVGTPVAVSPPDSMAALLGAGAAEPGHTVILAGSTMPVLGAAARPSPDPSRRTWTGRHPLGGQGVHESNAGTTGFGWAWVVERLVGELAGLRGDAAYAHADRLVASTAPGADGALAFSGGGSVMNATKPATFLTRYNGAFWPPSYVAAAGGADVVRACLEAVAYSARANLEQVESARGATGPVIVAGGMARSDAFVQMLADVLNRPVARPPVVEATAVGAAMSAATAAGIYTSLEEACTAMTSTAIAAEPDPAATAPYGHAFRDWRALYAKIESL